MSKTKLITQEQLPGILAVAKGQEGLDEYSYIQSIVESTGANWSILQHYCLEGEYVRILVPSEGSISGIKEMYKLAV